MKELPTRIHDDRNGLDGAISPEQAVKLRECLNHIDELNAHRDRIENEIHAISTMWFLPE